MIFLIIYLALVAGAGLCVLLFVYGGHQAVKLLFRKPGFRRAITRLVLHRPTHLNEYAHYAE